MAIEIRARTFEYIDSTNEEAKRQARQGAVDGTLILAMEQTAGRGRSGRAWSSPAGNFYSSLLLRNPGAAGEAALLSFAAALAVRDAITALAPRLTIALKWPNDVLVDGRKISGILLESSGSSGPGLDWLIIGVGVNLAHHPSDITPPATSLSHEGENIDFRIFSKSYQGKLKFWINKFQAEGFAPLRTSWLSTAFGVGEKIQVRLPKQTLSGIFTGLDASGALILTLEDGKRRLVTSGEVFFSGNSEET